MKYDHKTLIGAGIVVILLVIAFVFSFKHKSVEAPLPMPSVSMDVPETPAKPIVHKKKVAVDMTEGLSYTEAFMKYGKGNFLQFDDNCQSHPVSLSVVNGSKLMLDNRSAKSEVITVGDNSYAMGPFSFKIIIASASSIPTTYTIDCKDAQNVSTLIVE